VFGRYEGLWSSGGLFIILNLYLGVLEGGGEVEWPWVRDSVGYGDSDVCV